MAGNPTGEHFIRLINAVAEGLAHAYGFGPVSYRKRRQYQRWLQRKQAHRGYRR